MRRLACLALVVFALAATTTAASAQVIEYAAGASSLLGARGASLRVRAGEYSVQGGVGFRESSRDLLFGASAELPLGSWRWRIGDQAIPTSLPTDMFVGPGPIMARGLAATRTTRPGGLVVFAGASSRPYATPFFQASTPTVPAGLVSYDGQWSPRLKGYSRNFVSTRLTSIQGVEWAPVSALRLGAAGGLWNDAPYAAGSVALDLRRLVFRARYATAGGSRRRLPAVADMAAGPERENIRLQVEPVPWTRLTLSRQRFVSSSPADRTSCTLNDIAVGLQHHENHVHGSLSLSERAGPTVKGFSVGVQRQGLGRLDVGATYTRSFAVGVSQEHLAARARERLTPRLSLVQVLTLGGGRTGVAWGGELRLSRALLEVDHQITVDPFPPPGGSAWRRTTLVSARVPLPGLARMSTTTQVDPAGQVRHTIYGSGFAYAGPVGEPRTNPAQDRFARYVIRGRILDVAGAPLAGIALRIGGELVFSDARGRFEVGKSTAKSCSVEAALEENMFPGTYEVVSMPETAKPGHGAGPELRVVLRRVW